MATALHPQKDVVQVASTGVIRTGVGGWTYEPWRGVFYAAGGRVKLCR